jgi:hypothetical protein
MKKRNIGNTKAQSIMGMPFTMIFSIILMVFFVVVAFIAIRAFLSSRDCAQIGIFYDSLETEVKRAWNSQGTSFEFPGEEKIRLPKKLTHICFTNLSNRFNGEFGDFGEELSIYEFETSNVFLIPTKSSCDMPGKYVAHLDMEKITKKGNPYCIEIKGGVFSFNIDKGINKRLVEISK